MKETRDRLTARAKKILLQLDPTLFESGKVFSKDFLVALKSQEGMGARLAESLKIDARTLSKEIVLEELVKCAYQEALELKQPYVGSEHLLLALLHLNNSNLYEEAKKNLSRMVFFPSGLIADPSVGVNDLIDIFASNLNLKVASEYMLEYVEREPFDLLLSTLLQRDRPNPLLVGEPGVGKKSLVNLLATKMNEMAVPSSLLGYQIYEVDLLSLVTSNLNKGNVEQAITTFFAEILKLNRVIIYLKNFEGLFFSTGTGLAVPLIYNSFRAQLAESKIRYIATCSSDMHSRLSSDNPQSLEGFSVINVYEPPEDIIKKILEKNARFLSKYQHVSFSSELLEYIYIKAKEFLKEEKFPQKAIDIMDQAGAKVLLRKGTVPEEYKDLLEKSILLTQGLEKSMELREYDRALEIRSTMQEIDKLMFVNEKAMFGDHLYKVSKKDVDLALEDYGVEKEGNIEHDLSSISNLESRLSKRIVGQDEAVSLISKALLRAKLGLRSKKRPLGNFLFLGPTGVGKTELAKALAEEFFGEGSLIRLDMSDFGEKHNVARLVGAPPGYVGYGESGELTGKIERNPSSVVLFDEIEKAHPDVLNILLQIMEEGELVDAKGTTYDFSSAVVVLTSNLGTEIVHKPGIGFEAKIINDESLEKRLRSNLKRILKPELLNRLDEVVVFRRLNKEDQYKILDLLLEEIRENLAKQKVSIRISKPVKEYLLEKGYSEEYGARALRRTVEKEFLDRIAEVLLQKKKRPLNLSATIKEDAILVL